MILLIIISILQIIFILYIALQLIAGEKIESIEQDYSSVISKESSYYYEDFSVDNISTEDICHNIMKLNINHIYFIHGTFVGDDPFDILSFLERAFPNLKENIINKIRTQIKSGNNLFARELGNFHPNLIKRLKEICPKDTRFENFTWSSSNHHIARLRGSLNLMRSIHSNTSPGERVLLYGHSHAGQIFTLLSQLLSKGSIASQLKEVLLKSDVEITELNNLIESCKRRKFDFVTLGTPVRYTWNNKTFPHSTLLHFINHRGKVPMGGSLTSSITTKNGDYIQQWAVAGSDSKSPIKEDQKLNEELDLILGIGRDSAMLRRNIKFKKRLHKYGEHILVDFKDNSRVPNSFLTIFGHGVYTRKEPMLWIIDQSLKRMT